MRLAILASMPAIMAFGPAQDAQPGSSASASLPFNMPSYQRPAHSDPDETLGDFVARAACSDTIEHTRAANDRPPIENATDAPEPLLYRAVDREIDGCDVLTPVEDPEDIRPVPEGGPTVIIRSGDD